MLRVWGWRVCRPTCQVVVVFLRIGLDYGGEGEREKIGRFCGSNCSKISEIGVNI